MFAQISSLFPNRFQPRRNFDPKSMAELTDSVKAIGILQALLVRPVGDKFEIVAGERRYRAAMAAGLTEIPIFPRDLTDEQVASAATIENIERENMNPAEEAEGAAKVLGMCGGNRDEAAKRLGWCRATLDKRLGLMNASDKVRDALIFRKIDLGHAELLAAIPKVQQDKIIDMMLSRESIPTVAQFKSQLAHMALSLDVAIFDRSECAGCPHNSGTQQALFGESIEGANCTNGSCYNNKTTAALNDQAESLKDEFPVVRIVKEGENFTVLKLVAEGATGVGVDQAAACRGCANFGAAISAIPGKIGNVYRDQCFDPACNQKKVAERIKSENVATEEAKAAAVPGTAKQAKDKAATSGKPNPKPTAAAKVELSQRVKDYRVKVWREAYQKEAQKPEFNTVLLLTLAMSHNLGKVDNDLMRTVLSRLTGAQVPLTNVGAIAESVAATPEDVQKRLVVGVAAAVAKNIEENHLVALLGFMKVDLRVHWKLNPEYLGILTKSEIEVVADEIGLKTAMGDAFAKALSGKKDELIKAILAVDGFDYSAKLPSNILYSA